LLLPGHWFFFLNLGTCQALNRYLLSVPSPQSSIKALKLGHLLCFLSLRDCFSSSPDVQNLGNYCFEFCLLFLGCFRRKG
jgi:hypothetical protein